MAKVIPRTIKWDPSAAADVVAYRVYVAKDPMQPDYDSPRAEVAGTEIIAPDGFPQGTFDEDTLYNIGVSAVDDIGNESDITVVSAPFDFVAPDAPTNVRVAPLF